MSEIIDQFEPEEIVVKVDGLDVLWNADLSVLKSRFKNYIVDRKLQSDDIVVYTGQKQCILSGTKQGARFSYKRLE